MRRGKVDESRSERARCRRQQTRAQVQFELSTKQDLEPPSHLSVAEEGGHKDLLIWQIASLCKRPHAKAGGAKSPFDVLRHELKNAVAIPTTIGEISSNLSRFGALGANAQSSQYCSGRGESDW